MPHRPEHAAEVGALHHTPATSAFCQPRKSWGQRARTATAMPAKARALSTKRQSSGSACGATSHATMNPVAQTPTNSSGASPAAVIPEGGRKGAGSADHRYLSARGRPGRPEPHRAARRDRERHDQAPAPGVTKVNIGEASALPAWENARATTVAWKQPAPAQARMGRHHGEAAGGSTAGAGS